MLLTSDMLITSFFLYVWLRFKQIAVIEIFFWPKLKPYFYDKIDTLA